MSLSPPSSQRNLIHSRTITINGYSRDDGLWELEANLTDTKAKSFPVFGETRQPGEPIHDISVRITFDTRFDIKQADATIDLGPIRQICGEIAPSYLQKLVGLNLFNNFRHNIREYFHGIAGCPHLTELLMQLPTAALQTLAGQRAFLQDPDKKPFLLDGCHALDTRSALVREYFPRWYRKPDSANDQEPFANT